MKICGSYIKVLFLLVLVPNMLWASSELKYQSVKMPFHIGKGAPVKIIDMECAWVGSTLGSPSEVSFSQVQPNTACDKVVCDGLITCKGKMNIEKLIACGVDKETGLCPIDIQECINDKSISMRKDSQPSKEELLIDSNEGKRGFGK